MAKKNHSSHQPSPQKPHAEKKTTHEPKTLTTPPPSKPSPPPSDSSRKKPTFFSENDVLLIVKSLSDFKSKTGNDPSTHYAEFRESIIDSLSVKPTIRQLREKVRSLRLQFEKKKWGNNEEVLTFPSAQKKELFQLSEKFWGHENGFEVKEKRPKKENDAKKPSKLKKPVQEELPSCKGKMGYLNLSEMFGFNKMCMGVNVMKRGMNLIGESDREELERRGKKLKVQEMEVFVKRAELVVDHGRLILEELQGSS